MFGNSEQIGDKPMYKILPVSRECRGANYGSAVKTIFVLGLFILLICNTDAGYKCGPGMAYGMTSPPGDIYIKYGDDLEVFCHMDMKHRPGLNASNLQFRHGESLVDPNWTSIVNVSTLQLHVPRPSRSDIQYHCKLCEDPKSKGDCETLCYNLVIVEDAPANVTDFECVSENWNNLTCSWSAPHSFVKVSYKLTFQLESQLQGYYECPQIMHKKINDQNDTYSCFWNSTTSPPYRAYYPKYIFTLVSTNRFGNNSQQIKFNHYANTIPGKPVHLNNTTRSAHSVTLQWELLVPMQDFEKRAKLEHRLMYTNEYNNSHWEVLQLKIDHLHVKDRLIYEYTLSNLPYANTDYDVRIYVRSAMTDREDRWSKFASLIFKTMPEIPLKSPDTFLGGFEFSEYGDRKIRDVIVYWKQLEKYEKNGNNFTYEIMGVTENENSLQVQPNEITDAYAKFINISRESLTFTVSSRNEIGYSENESYVYVPELSNNLKKPEFLHKLPLGEGVFDLEWKPPVNGLRVDSYTVFWCADKNDRPFQCKGYLEAQKVSSNLTKLQMNVTEKNKIYQFAISANYGELSSGMLWASCTLQDNVVGSIEDVSIETVGSNFIVMRWNLACSGKTDIIKGFRLYYCKVKDSFQEHCDGIQNNITIYGDISLKHGNLTDLIPYSTYSMTVSLLTIDKEGPASAPLYQTTLEGAPSPPRNLRIAQVTNKTMLVSWDQPEFSNGVLQYYKVLCNGNGHITEINTGKNRQAVLNNLTGYTDYNISVVACNKECSKLSESVGVRTAIGPPGTITKLLLDNEIEKTKTNNSATLMWHPPNPAGGKIDMYEIKEMRRSKNPRSNDTLEKNFKTTDTKLELSDFNCKENYLRPDYYIRAINFDNELYHGVKPLWNDKAIILDNGYSARPVNAVYRGKWSLVKDFSLVPCDGEGNNSNIMWILGVMIPILIVLLAIALKKGWHKFKIMTDIEVIMPPGLVPAMEKDSAKLAIGNWGAQQNNEYQSAADEESLLKKSKSILDTKLHKPNTDFSVSSDNTNSTTVSESDTSQKESSGLVKVVATERVEDPETSLILTNLKNQNKALIKKDDLHGNFEDDNETIPGSEDCSIFSHNTTNLNDKPPSGYVSMPSNSVNAPKYVTTSMLPPADFVQLQPVKNSTLPAGYVQTAPSQSLMQAIAAPHTSALMQPIGASSTQPSFSPKDKGYVEFSNLINPRKPVTPLRMIPVVPDVKTGYISNVPFNTHSGLVLEDAIGKNIAPPNMDYVMVANSQTIPKSRPATPVLSPSVEKSLEVVRNPMSGYVSVQDPMLSKHSNVATRPHPPIKTEATLSPEAYCRYGWSTEPDPSADDYESLLHDIIFDKQSGSNIIEENISS